MMCDAGHRAHGVGALDPERGKPKPIILDCGCEIEPGSVVQIWEKDGHTSCGECLEDSLRALLYNGWGVLAHAMDWSEV